MNTVYICLSWWHCFDHVSYNKLKEGICDNSGWKMIITMPTSDEVNVIFLSRLKNFTSTSINQTLLKFIKLNYKKLFQNCNFPKHILISLFLLHDRAVSLQTLIFYTARFWNVQHCDVTIATSHQYKSWTNYFTLVILKSISYIFDIMIKRL